MKLQTFFTVILIGLQLSLSNPIFFFKFPNGIFNWSRTTATTSATTTTTAATTTTTASTTSSTTSSSSNTGSSGSSVSNNSSTNVVMQTSANISIGNRQNTSAGLVDMGQNISNIIVSFGQQRSERSIFLSDFDDESEGQGALIGNRENSTVGLVDYGQNVSNIIVNFNRNLSKRNANFYDLKKFQSTALNHAKSNLTDIIKGNETQSKRIERSLLSDISDYAQHATNKVALTIEEQIRKFSKQYENDRNNFIDDGTKKLTNALNKVKFTSVTVTKGVQLLGEQGEKQFEGINDFVSNLGDNITDCFNNNPFPYEEIINKTVETALECVENSINDATNTSEKIKNILQNNYNNPMNGNLTIQICYNNFPATDPLLQIARIGCLGKALLKIRSQTILLPVEIAKRITDARSFFATIESNLLQCASNITEEIAKLAIEASQKIAQCISDKQTI